MKLIKLLEWRKISLPFVAFVFNLLRLNPFRSRQIWLFGCWRGQKYDDNSKFLFEYVNKNHSNVRCIWLTHNKQFVKMIRSFGFEAYLTGSLRGAFYSLRCGVAIMTNGLDDFGKIPLVGGAKIVALWHGVGGFKKIYNENYSGYKLMLKKSLDSFFSWVYRDFSVSTSEYTLERIMEQFSVKQNSVVITGQPRNDLFQKPLDRNKIISGIQAEKYAKVVLYMPTYRISRHSGKDVVKDILNSLIACEKFKLNLVWNNVLFLVKLHPLTDFKTESVIPNIKVLKDNDVASVQHLLMVADVLVTDYSSCCVDYALLKRPIIFYVPDETDYLSYSSLNDAYFKVVREKARNEADLVSMLSTENLNQTNMLNDLFEDKSIAGTCYSENVYQMICDKCGVKR